MRMRTVAAVALAALLSVPAIHAACCYFSAQERDVNQPGQKAFITWEPESKRESFTVQPAFEGDARDFGMVIPTPSRPKLDEMPRDFFKHLAIYTILLPLPEEIRPEFVPLPRRMYAPAMQMVQKGMDQSVRERGAGVEVLEAGIVGSLDYKILTAEEARGLYEWLEDNGYAYAGDEATLDHYVQKKWLFTVMKIDTAQMKRGPDGTYTGEVTPTRFAFETAALVYPLKITSISVKESTEALFYVLAPQQMDLQGNWSWAWSYRVMWLTSGRVCISQKAMTPEEQQELADRQRQLEEMRQEIPGFDTTKLEWAKRLDDADSALLADPAKHYAQAGLPDLPEGSRTVSLQEAKDELWNEFVASGNEVTDHARAVLAGMDEKYPASKGVVVREKPSVEGARATFWWFPNREAPSEEVAKLAQLRGHLKEGLFLTKLRKSFTRGEMKRDLDIVPAEQAIRTEYLRILPQSPP